MQMVDLVNKSGSLLPPLALKGAKDLEVEVHSNPKMMMKQKQGIVSILGLHESDHKSGGTTTYNKAVPPSLRRTLSADMSSKKWLEQNGLITPSSSFTSSHVPMKKIASSQHIASILDSSYEEEDDASSKNNRTQSDIWSSILSQKGDGGEDDASSKLPPYVHPQVKKSKSLLSEKSLEICTESLGSETGSDVFTSGPVSEEEKEVEEDQQAASQQQHGKVSEFVENEEFEAVKYTPYSTTKKAAIARPFPPPLPSLARSEGPSLHMHSHRRDGRLVLEAVSIPSQNCFQAQRQDGRLLLTLINSTPDHLGVEELVPQLIEKEEEEDFDRFEDDEEIDENSKDMDEVGMFFMEKQEEEQKVASGIINVHGSTVLVTMKKIVERDNTIWANYNKYFNYKINNNYNINLMKQLDDVVEDEEELEPIAANQVNGNLAVTQSLPPPPPVPGRQAATSLVNTYQYFWRAKPTMASVIINHNNPVVAKTSGRQTEPVAKLNNSFHKMYEQKESLVVVRGNKADCTVPTLRGCKEPKRSLLMWEPHCIATS